eukprot:5953704-Pleurochrysis_carterae.AAC.1
MKQQIQAVLRKAGAEARDRGTEKERADLRGVEVTSVQQLYVSVRGMRTSAATNKCEFGYITPSGEELRWGPTSFTLYAEFHKRSRKVKEDTARTFHTVRGALVLNEQKKWCELCACAHGKDCQLLVAFRAEEARRKQELLARTKRESAPTRAQQQAARPEYTLSVEKEKQVRSEEIVEAQGTKMLETNVLPSNAGARGGGPHGLRGGGQRSWRSEGEAANGAERGQDADGVQGLSPAPRELSVLPTQVQVFPVQSPQERDPHHPKRYGIRGRKERENARVATGRQERPGRRGGTQSWKGKRGQIRWQCEWMVKGSEHNAFIWNGKGEVRQGRGRRQDGRIESQQLARTAGHGMADDLYTRCMSCRWRYICDCAIGKTTCERRVTALIAVHTVGSWTHKLCNMVPMQCSITCVISNAIGEACWFLKIKFLLEDKVIVVLQSVSWLAVMLLIARSTTKRRVHWGKKEEKVNRRGTRGERQTRRLIEQRRQVLKRIKAWCLARKLVYDGSIERKYRNKVRASKRWSKQKSSREAVVANKREYNRRNRGGHGGLGERKGGAGKQETAAPIVTIGCEDELMKDIGEPQYTWGDGSCWLWAVAGAM